MRRSREAAPIGDATRDRIDRVTRDRIDRVTAAHRGYRSEVP